MLFRKKLFLFIISCALGCEADESMLDNFKTEGTFSYNQSLSEWQKLKALHGDSYTYQISFQSWTGSGFQSDFRIEQGFVTERSYSKLTIDSAGTKSVKLIYNEKGTAVGSHEEGPAPLTIDELYHNCANEFLNVDKKSNSLYFAADESGVLKTCGFVPKGCQDDCFQGIRITSFAWIPKPTS